MDRESRRHLDEFRREAGPVENTLIDEFVEGELSPRDFIRRATVFGLSASVIGTVLGRWAGPACLRRAGGRTGWRPPQGCDHPAAGARARSAHVPGTGVARRGRLSPASS